MIFYIQQQVGSAWINVEKSESRMHSEGALGAVQARKPSETFRIKEVDFSVIGARPKVEPKGFDLNAHIKNTLCRMWLSGASDLQLDTFLTKVGA